MYYPEIYFNIDTLDRVLKLYDWPSKYELVETNSGDIVVEFDKCKVVVSEGFESDMYAYFPNELTGRNNKQVNLELFHAIQIMRPIAQNKIGYKEPKGLKLNLEGEPSLQKVEDGLHNICILLQAYLLPCIEGDFSWVEEYNKQHPENLTC